jgi:hypothetical protein
MLLDVIPGFFPADLNDENSLRAIHQQSTCRKIKLWKRRWYGLSPILRQQLRVAFGNDRKTYYRSYEARDQDIRYFQELGMQNFLKIERKLLWQMRTDPYIRAGRTAIESFGAAFTGENPVDQAHYTFALIDFEGIVPQDIAEFGLVTLDAADVLSSRGRPNICCVNYKVKTRGKPKFMFGNTIRIWPESLSRTIIEIFSEFNKDDMQRKIILIGHGIHNELRILDDLGVFLEDLPVTGVVDACDLAFDGLRARIEYSGSAGSAALRR